MVKKQLPSHSPAEHSTRAAFSEVAGLIRAARQRAVQAVNTELIDLYWLIGHYLHHRIKADGWAKGTAYPDKEKLSTLLRELPWSARLEYQLVEQPAIGLFAEPKSPFRLHKSTSGVSRLRKLSTPAKAPNGSMGFFSRQPVLHARLCRGPVRWRKRPTGRWTIALGAQHQADADLPSRLSAPSAWATACGTFPGRTANGAACRAANLPAQHRGHRAGAGGRIWSG